MKKTRYYLDVKMPAGLDHDWADVSASAPVPLYIDKTTREIYCYEYNGETSWAHRRDESITWRWEVKLIRTEEVQVQEKITKLPSDDRYKNGYNWKAKGPNARLRKKQPNNLAEEKAKRDAEFFKLKEEMKRRGNV